MKAKIKLLTFLYRHVCIYLYFGVTNFGIARHCLYTRVHLLGLHAMDFMLILYLQEREKSNAKHQTFLTYILWFWMTRDYKIAYTLPTSFYHCLKFIWCFLHQSGVKQVKSVTLMSCVANLWNTSFAFAVPGI